MKVNLFLGTRNRLNLELFGLLATRTIVKLCFQHSYTFCSAATGWLRKFTYFRDKIVPPFYSKESYFETPCYQGKNSFRACL